MKVIRKHNNGFQNTIEAYACNCNGCGCGCGCVCVAIIAPYADKQAAPYEGERLPASSNSFGSGFAK